jgi:thiol-disulfide isomerase/thioredoxin
MTRRAAVGSLLIASGCGMGPKLVGKPAPDFTLPDLMGRRVSLSELRGRPVLLQFWATWCGVCRRDLPSVRSIQSSYGNELIVLAVSIDDTLDKLRAFQSAEALNYRVLVGSESPASWQPYEVQGVPTYVIIDRAGVVRAKMVGAVGEGGLRSALRRAGI